MMSQFNNYSFNAERPLEKYKKSDISFLLSVIIMWGIGIFTLFFCSQGAASRIFDDSFYFVKRQLVCSLVGFCLLFFFALSPIHFIRSILPVIVIGSIVLCLLTFVPGISVEKNGARRWLRMPFNFTFQPSELCKFTMILFLANYFDKQEKIQNPDEKTVLPCVIALNVFMLLVFAQNDMSTGVFILIVGLVLFFVSGAKIAWVPPYFVLAIPAAILMVLLKPHRLERFIGYFNPSENITGINYQSIAAGKAISSGGLLGTGIGSDLRRLNSIPEVQSDYIFAGWTEAFGFAGVIIFFFMLCVFAWRGVKIALNSKSRFAAVGAFGCVFSIVFQSLVNCAVVCGLLPTTGIPLPFFSLGGSSIIVTLAMCGFVLNASRCDEDSDDINDDFENQISYEYKNINLEEI